MLMNNIGKLKYILLSAALLLVVPCMGSTLKVHAATVVPTDVTKPSKGCVLVGTSGNYVSDVEAVLKQMNAYRLEACKKGYKNPETGKPLTLKDYKPLYWSYDLEYIARIRAAENSVTFSHIRPSGKSCFTLQSPKGIGSSCEIIAGSSQSDTPGDLQSIMKSLNLWYREKELWLKGQGTFLTTGHYTSMINPSYRYIGLATFTYSCDNGKWAYVTCGEFSQSKSLNRSNIKDSGSSVQTVEINKSLLNKTVITGATTLMYGKETTWKVSLKTNVDRLDKATLLPIGSVTWKSSNPSVAKVDSTGKILAVGSGTANITAHTKGGTIASRKITVKGYSIKNLTIGLDRTISVYNGKKQLPKVIVKDSSGNQIKTDNYTISYVGNYKKIGIYKVKITFKKKYSGSLTLSYSIVPPNTGINRIVISKRTMKVSWKKQLNQITGYQIKYATDLTFKKGKQYITIYGTNNIKKTIKNLQSGKWYYVKIRTFKMVGRDKVYSKWSGVTVVRIQ